ncbi:hypothetical protein AnigIFM56816_000504 [Aspergillus niger]|nr:hypothetical protein AnigIFM56816_000504 [Aspergillus niger]
MKLAFGFTTLILFRPLCGTIHEAILSPSVLHEINVWCKGMSGWSEVYDLRLKLCARFTNMLESSPEQIFPYHVYLTKMIEYPNCSKASYFARAPKYRSGPSTALWAGELHETEAKLDLHGLVVPTSAEGQQRGEPIRRVCGKKRAAPTPPRQTKHGPRQAGGDVDRSSTYAKGSKNPVLYGIDYVQIREDMSPICGLIELPGASKTSTTSTTIDSVMTIRASHTSFGCN